MANRSARMMAFPQPLLDVVKRQVEFNHEHQGVIEEISQFVKLLVTTLPQGRDQDLDRFLTDLLYNLFPPRVKESVGITAHGRVATPVADYRFQLIEHIVHT